ncbi:hypothetical protein ORIO_20585 (plasmid) [Cereibacter azotoformans]|uniref:hypothetical protein n=1 Tax=Cereibacter azotoformans TaxID=43057 RepID=UPI000C6C9E26|nr:hypothetical protein [Cereibacter azotoformans]AXQ96096.1 hypothetical protein D0Z66_20460 [Cereibacter sphaeroides]UIJ32936.1 hypothetical protein LV780_20405 [Cereibacter azotoformans]ULB12198.1 hypothetical protein ORIO_20585 [Cereibacter azotoformans]
MKLLLAGVLPHVSALAIFAVSASAQDLDIQRDATLLIVETAERICGITEDSGSSSELNVEGKTDATLGVLSRRLLNLGIEGGANLDEHSYKNVLREQLADELKDSRQCRQIIFDQMFAKVFGAAPREVLQDQTDEILAGGRLPHQLDIIGPNQMFQANPGESVALGRVSRIFSLNDVLRNTNLGPLVHYSWVDMAAGTSDGGYTGQAQPIKVADCAMTPYRIDVEEKTASFFNTCGP